MGYGFFRADEIPKADGGKRLFGEFATAPTVTDRMVQQAIAQVLMPIFDPTFSASSFGYVRFAHPASRDQPSTVLRPCGAGRPGRNAHQAIKQVQAYVNDGLQA